MNNTGFLDAAGILAEKREAQTIKRRDAKMKAAGATYRLTASIYPLNGGDDEIVDAYIRCPTYPSQVRAKRILEAKGDKVFGDVVITDLESIDEEKVEKRDRKGRRKG